MSAVPFIYLTERYAGDPGQLAERLQLVGITVREWEPAELCGECRGPDGRRWREIGEVCVYAGERIVVWSYTDASREDRVTLLRTAERVVTDGFDGADEPGWTRRVTTSGRVYHWCQVIVPIDDASAARAEEMGQQDVAQEFASLMTAGGLLEVLTDLE